MSDKKRVLVIDLDDYYARGFLFQTSATKLELIGYKKSIISLEERSDFIELFKSRFQENYDRVEVVSNREDWFGRGVQTFSAWGTTTGICINAQNTIVETRTFGRLINHKLLNFGLGRGIEPVLSSGGLTYLKSWFAVNKVNDEQSITALNSLGNYTRFPTHKINNPTNLTSILGMIRYILTQVALINSFYTSRVDGKEERGVFRIILSGDVFTWLPNVGELFLAVVDSLQLEGIWEIYLDKRSVMTSIGYEVQNIKNQFEKVGLVKLGSVLVLSHKFKWGDKLGELSLDLGLTTNQRLVIKSGEIVRIPFEESLTGSITFDVHQEVRVRGYQKLVELKGGKVGLVIDARGRPLPTIEEPKIYQDSYPHWKEALEA